MPSKNWKATIKTSLELPRNHILLINSSRNLKQPLPSPLNKGNSLTQYLRLFITNNYNKHAVVTNRLAIGVCSSPANHRRKKSSSHRQLTLATDIGTTHHVAVIQPKMRVGEDDLPSLEYIEDPYFPKLDNCITPSLDDITEYNPDDLELGYEQNWPEETELYLRSLTLDQILGVSSDEDVDQELEMQTVETEFSPLLHSETSGNGMNGTTSNPTSESRTSVGVLKSILANKLLNNGTNKFNLFSKKRIRDVRVTFIDFSKPYLARISSGDNYKSFLNIGSAVDNSGKLSDASPVGSVSSAEIAQEFSGLTVEEQEAQRAEWSQELARVEEEITTLRTVLQSKIRHSSELKRKLGITVWKEITDDVSQGLKNVKESNVYQTVETKVGEITTAVTSAPIYQKTETAIKTTAGKTTSVLGGITSKMTQKISDMKQSDSFRSFEERVGSAYENVKSKVSSRSSSVQSLSDLQNDERRNSVTTSTAIPEEKPVP